MNSLTRTLATSLVAAALLAGADASAADRDTAPIAVQRTASTLTTTDGHQITLRLLKQSDIFGQ